MMVAGVKRGNRERRNVVKSYGWLWDEKKGSVEHDTECPS